MPTRPRFAFIIVASLLTLAACKGGNQESAGPNVILVVLDTLRPDRLGCYGGERETSPNLDAMAEEFFLFENAQSPAPWTAPSLISLMTSTYPNTHGVHGFPVPGRLGGGFTTLAEVLKRNGYQTAAFTEGGYAKGDFGLDRGFDVYPENLSDSDGYTSNLAHPSRLVANLDRSIEWLRDKREEPFFLFFHTYEVHSPPRAPIEDVRVFRRDFDPEHTEAASRAAIGEWNANRVLTADGAREMRRFVFLQGRHMGSGRMPKIEDREALNAKAQELGIPLEFDAATSSPEDMAWVQDLYDAEIHFTDRHIARLWSAIEEEGLAEDTILVITSDHGEALGEHGRVGHGHVLHDEVLHVLLMLRVPGQTSPPRRISEPVRTVDITPTLLELVGLDTSDLFLQGRSLMPLINGEDDSRPTFSQATMANGGHDGRRTVRTAKWRLLVDTEAGTTELFDLAQDPGATKDVAAQHPGIVAELIEVLGDQDIENEQLRERLGGVEPSEIDPDSDLMKDLRGLGYTGD